MCTSHNDTARPECFDRLRKSMFSLPKYTINASAKNANLGSVRDLTETITMSTPKPYATRQTATDSWLRRLREAYLHYQNAAKHYNRLLKERPYGTPSTPESVLALARQAESEALADYSRILRAFSDLTVYGDAPEKQSAASSNSL